MYRSMEYIVPILRDWINPQYYCQYLEKPAPYLSHTPKNWASENPVKHGKRLGIAQNCSKWAQNCLGLLQNLSKRAQYCSRRNSGHFRRLYLPIYGSAKT